MAVWVGWYFPPLSDGQEAVCLQQHPSGEDVFDLLLYLEALHCHGAVEGAGMRRDLLVVGKQETNCWKITSQNKEVAFSLMATGYLFFWRAGTFSWFFFCMTTIKVSQLKINTHLVRGKINFCFHRLKRLQLLMRGCLETRQLSKLKAHSKVVLKYPVPLVYR